MKVTFLRFVSLALVPVGLALVMIGCGPSAQTGPATVEVSGTVSYDGQPLQTGQIVFLSAQTGERSYSGKIENGQFSFQSEPGAKKVQITATREVKVDPSKLSEEEQVQLEEEGGAGTVPEQYIPARYNSETELTAEVKGSGSNKFEFKLESGE